MGRGRAKAKQTKVARNLKYRTTDTDFESLERELRGAGSEHEIPDAYADLADEYSGDDRYEYDPDDESDQLRKTS